MDSEAILKTIDGLMAKAAAIQAEYAGKDEPMPKEKQDELAALLGRVDEWRAQLLLVKRMETAQCEQYEAAGTPKALVNDVVTRPAAPMEGVEAVDEKSWRSIEVKTVRVDPIFGVPVVETTEVRYHVPLAVQRKGYSSAFEAYLRKADQIGPNDYKTLMEGSDSAGGFLVPEDYQAELIKKIATMATIRSRARVATTGRDIVKWVRIVYTTDDKYTSPVRLTWTGESPSSSTVHAVTDPVFGLYSIPVHTAMASMALSNDLIEDSAFDVAGISTDLLAEAFALDENDAFINGNGIGRPSGILKSVADGDISAVVSGTAATLTADGLISLAYALPAQYETGAVWVMNKATEAVIRKLKTDDKQYLLPVVSNVGGLGVAPRELLGFPILRDEFVPDVAADAYPIIFGDLRGYLIVDRVGLSVQRLTDSAYAKLNMVGLLARKRVGGQVIEPWRLKVQKVSAS